MAERVFSRSVMGCVCIALASIRVFAQTPLPSPPQTLYGPPITIERAKTAAAASVAEAQAHSWNMAIAIVDNAGFLVYFERMSNTQLASVELSIAKAKTSALFRRPTKVFQDAVAGGGDGLRVLGLTGAMPNAGGIPIVVDDRIIGAVGVSGGSVDHDAQVAAAGARAVK